MQDKPANKTMKIDLEKFNGNFNDDKNNELAE